MSARSSDGITSRVPQARPERPVFPSGKLDEILLEMLMFRPATSPTISNEMTQVWPAARVAPLKLIVWEPAIAVKVEPGQLLTMLGWPATTIPGERSSLNEIPTASV